MFNKTIKDIISENSKLYINKSQIENDKKSL